MAMNSVPTIRTISRDSPLGRKDIHRLKKEIIPLLNESKHYVSIDKCFRLLHGCISYSHLLVSLRDGTLGACVVNGHILISYRAIQEFKKILRAKPVWHMVLIRTYIRTDRINPFLETPIDVDSLAP